MLMDKKTVLRVALFGFLFLYVIATILEYNERLFQQFYIPSPDGDLYLSIANNYLGTGHFIQTQRPNEINMIVPPGLPFIVAVFLRVCNSVLFLVFFQYCLVGLSIVLLSLTAKKLTNSYLGAITVTVSYVQLWKLLTVPNPGQLLTEVYTVFFLALFLYIISTRISRFGKSILLWITSSCILFIRPACSLLLIIPATLAFLEIFDTKKRCDSDRTFLIDEKRSLSHKLLAYTICLVLLAGCLVVNGLNNKKETGVFVWMENYGSSSVYLANNPNTKTSAYSSSEMDEFSDDFFVEVYSNKALDWNEKNALFSTRSREYVFSHLGITLKNAVTKYFLLFDNKTNGLYLWTFPAALIMFALVFRKHGWVSLIYAGSFLLITCPTAFGLLIARYSMASLLFYALGYGLASGCVVELAKRCYLIQKEKKKVPNNLF